MLSQLRNRPVGMMQPRAALPPLRLASARHLARTSNRQVQVGAVKTWQATVLSNSPLLGDTSVGIEYQVVDMSGVVSDRANMNNWTLKPRHNNDYKRGWIKFGDVQVPEQVTDPAAIIMRKRPSKSGEDSLDYISEVSLDMGGQKVVFPVHSWVSSDHGDRVFFAPEAYLPSETPAALREFRDKDLQQLRGEDKPGKLKKKREGADRIYDYQVYDDLGSPSQFRPALGGSGVRPYPRRLATNRKHDSQGQEVPVAQDPDSGNPTGAGPWLPYDERFNFSKEQGFKGEALVATIPALVSRIKNIPPWKLAPALLYKVLCSLPGIGDKLPKREYPPVEDFEDFRDVLALFGKDISEKGLTVDSMMAKSLYPAGAAMGMSAARRTAGTESRFKDKNGSWDFGVDNETRQAAKDALAKGEAGPAVMASASGTPALAAATLSSPAMPQMSAVTAIASNGTLVAVPSSSLSSAGAAAADVDTAPPQPGLGDILKFARSEIKKEGGLDDLLQYDMPRCLENRPDAWAMDEEVGRQALAGMNPCTLTALKVLPATLGSAIRNEHVAADLQGHTLEELVAAAAAGQQPRVFIMDYWALSTFWDMTPDNTDMCQHAGRALFFLRRASAPGEQDALVPVAIELGTKDNHMGKAGTVYSHSELAARPQTQAVWRLAKAVFRSLDSSYHQLISHWLRTHACLEPFFIAMRRQMSIMHPVLKLMLPHFRYTLHINANARSSLINAGGIIEDNFSAGEFAMRLSSECYKGWRFRLQALPEDLKNRGMIDPATGKPWMEYPYAEDGMDLWNAFEDYFAQYLAHHYGNDGTVDADAAVAADVELQAWWTEVKNVGHADLVQHGLATEEDVWGFTGPIKTQAQLVNILVTIAWTASAHHAAVNFGQYDFSSLLLNFSSMVRRPMPVPGSKAYEELVNAPLGSPQERVFMTYLSHVGAAASVMTTVKLLSGHAEGEQTLDQPNEYLKDPYDEELNLAFIAKMTELERQFEQRNNNPKSWTRAVTKLNPKTMPYTLLLPSSGPGVTCRGVPYSVSI